MPYAVGRRVALTALALLIAPSLAPAEAASVDAEFGHLAYAPRLPTVVATDDAIYVFGGHYRGFMHTNASRIDLATGVINEIAYPPNVFIGADFGFWDPRDRPEAGCDDGCIYILGIYDRSREFGTVLRFHPKTETYTFLDSVWPPATAAPGAWDGRYAYVFGGYAGFADLRNTIYRYDPLLDEFALMNATLPEGRDEMAVAWANGAAYLFGGYGCEWPHPENWDVCDEILRYDPTSDTLTLVGHLPERLTSSTAVWDGHNVLIAGGTNRNLYGVSRVMKHDPVTGETTLLDPPLPTARFDHGAAWADGALYIIGGIGETLVGDVTRYTLEPAAPDNVEVMPAIGGTLVRWTPPANNTYSVLTGYRIYRAPIQHALASFVDPATLTWELAAQPGADQTAYLDPSPPGTRAYKITAINADRDEGPSATAPLGLWDGPLL